MNKKYLWYAVLMVAAFCSVNLDALPVGNTNDACVVNDAYESDLFEGDLKVSIETIRQIYDLNETQDKELTAMLGGNSSNHVGTRAAIRVTSRLWMNATVPYLFDLRQSTYSKLSIIRNAMDEWECSTCLRFVPRISHNDYVNFTDADCNRCYSHIGQYPSKRQQEINLGEGCFTHRTVLHEIGHALGYWHEHTRPDRDSYVNVIDNNIIPRKRTNFMKRTVNEVDSRGFGYDYSSVMHYDSDAFALRGNTLEVNNNSAYEMQGSPPFGHLPHLSSGDIDQTNHLYSCPEPGGNGFLMVEIYSGKNLENKDTHDASDPYVQVVAVSSTGLYFYRQTSTQTDNLNPTWKELLLFSNRRWKSIRIKVWDEDDGTDDSISITTQTVPLVDRYKCKNWRKHCTNTNCDSYVWYRYKLKAPIHGLLRVNIQYARNLPNTDVGYARRRALTKPDPYVKVTIVMPSGSHYTKSTAIKVETQNPTWNERLDMKEECEWVIFKVQIWDDDGNQDDKMSDPEYIEVSPSSQYVSVEDHKHCAYGSDCDAYLYLDYEFVPDGDECNPNPCLNGGTCTDGCASYTCSCVYPYTGPNCEYGEGSLRFFGMTGTGFPADITVYIEIIAYDIYGTSCGKVSSVVHSNGNPSWDQAINFDRHTWRHFMVKVWNSNGRLIPIDQTTPDPFRPIDNIFDTRQPSTSTIGSCPGPISYGSTLLLRSPRLTLPYTDSYSYSSPESITSGGRSLQIFYTYTVRQ